MNKVYTALVLAAVFLFLDALAQISLTTPNANYTQDFDEMGASGTVLPAGWAAIRYAGSVTAIQTLTPAVTNGNANSGGIYNVGTTGETDRALGILASGSTVPAFGASFTNNTGSVLGNLSFSGVTEQ